jgi:hypothetical protein
VADLYYYEEGYIDISYHVYVADAEIALGPYIEENYIDANYYDDYSSVASLTCELTLRPGETVSATGAWTSEFTQTSVVGRLQSASANFTGAFAPTLTVDAFKNHTAILESTSTFTVDAQANRSANVLLEHIANLNAQAAKTAVVDSTMATQATLSSAPVKSVVSSATFTSTTTVSCLAFNVTFFDAQLSFGSAVTTSRFLGTGRPRTGTVDASAYYDATTKYEGTHSIARSGLGSIYTSDQYDQFRPKANQAFFFSTYVWVDEGPGPAGTAKILAGIGQFTDQNPSSRSATEDMWYVSMGSRQLSVTWNIGGTWYTGTNSGIDLNGTAGWVNINFYRSYDSPSIFYSASGSPVAGGFITRGRSLPVQNGALVQPSTAANRKLKLFGVDNAYYIGADPITRFDDLSYSVNDQTQIVLKFNNNSTDTLEVITHEGAAALTSTASVTAIGTNVKGAASAGLTSTVTVSANAGKLQTAAATLESTVTQSTSAVKTVQAVVDITANAAVSATVYRIKQFVSDQNALFTPSVTVQAQLAGVALLESQFTQSTSAVKTTDVQVDMTSTVSVAVSATVTAGFAGDLNTAATTSILGYRTRFADSNLNASTALTCDFVAFNNVSADLVSEITVTAAVTKLKIVEANLSAEFTQTTSAVKTTDAASTISSEYTLTADNVRIRFADSQQSAEFTQTTQAVKTSRYQIDITVATTQTTAVNFVAENIIPVGSLFEPSINADAQFAGFALLESTSTVTALIGAIRQATNITSTGLQINSSDPYIDNLTGMPFFGLKVRSNTFTASIWARRESTPSTLQPLWSSNSGDSGALVFNGTDLMLRFNYDADEPNAVWTNVVPTDGEWHQYLIRTVSVAGNEPNTSNPGAGNRWQLWIDGAYQGQSSPYFAAGQIEFNNGGRALLGHALIRDLTGGYELNGRRLTGAIAQVWMGLTNNQQFNPVLFYDSGFVDLGTTGNLGGLLPTPLIYNPLQTPFTSITGTGLTTATTPLGYSPTVIRATTAITANAVLLVIADISVNASQTTLISYVIRPVIAFTSSATVSATATAFTGIIADITAESTVSATVFRTQEFTSAITAVASVGVIVGATEQFDAAVTAQFTLDCDSVVKPPIRTEANLLSQFTVTADPASFTDAITMMMSSGTLTADVTVIPPVRAEANLVTTSTLTVIIGSIEQFAVLTASSGTMSITAVKRTGILETLSTVSTVTATITHYKGIILTVTAFNTQLTAGDIINLDPYLTLKINSETRGLLILKETRDITIESETRVNII